MIVCSLVVSCRSHEIVVVMIHEREETELPSLKESFEYDRVGHLETLTKKLLCLYPVVGNENALSQCQTVLLDHERSDQCLHMGDCILIGGARGECSGWNVVGMHEPFCEVLIILQSRCMLQRTEDGN